MSQDSAGDSEEDNSDVDEDDMGDESRDQVSEIPTGVEMKKDLIDAIY